MTLGGKYTRLVALQFRNTATPGSTDFCRPVAEIERPKTEKGKIDCYENCQRLLDYSDVNGMHGLSISLADQLYTLGDAHNYACVLVASHIGHMHVLFPPACFPRCRLRPMISLPSTTTTFHSMQQEPPANRSSNLPLLSTFSGGCTSCTAPIFSCKEYLQFLMSISPFRDLVIFTQPLSPDIPLSLKLSDGRWSSLPKIYLKSCRTGNRIQRHKHQYKLSQHSKGLST